MQDTKHYVAVVVASSIWGLFAFVLRPLRPWSPAEILFYRVFLSASLLLLTGFIFRRKSWASDLKIYRELPSADKRGILLQALGEGFFLTGNWFFFIYVLNTVSIKVASLAYRSVPF